MNVKVKARTLLSVLSFFLSAAMAATAPQATAMPGVPAAQLQSPADEELEDQVRGALGATMGKPALEIGVSARDGTVTLYGKVRNRSLRDRAARSTEKVLGVRTVVNALTVVRGS